MSTKHTLAPLTYIKSKRSGLFHIETASDAEFAGVHICSVTSEEDAARIVACVNAMADIEDPAKLRQTWEAVKELELDAYHKMKQELDELCSLLLKVQKSGAINPTGTLWQEISAAIATNKPDFVNPNTELSLKVESLLHALKTVQLRYNESFEKEHQELIAKAIAYATN